MAMRWAIAAKTPGARRRASEADDKKDKGAFQVAEAKASPPCLRARKTISAHIESKGHGSLGCGRRSPRPGRLRAWLREGRG
jgi:hypothetical protein